MQRQVAEAPYPRKTTMAAEGPCKFFVRGLLSDTTYHMARCCAEVSAYFFLITVLQHQKFLVHNF